MSIFSSVLSADKEILDTFFEKMRNLYGRMDRAYDKSAANYDFSCRGCKESCCE